MQASAAPPACGGRGPAANAAAGDRRGAVRRERRRRADRRPPAQRRSPAETAKHSRARRSDWAVAPETRPAQRRGPRERSRRQRSAAQSGGGSSRVFLRQGPGSPNVFRTKQICDRAFYNSCRPLTTRRLGQQRGAGPRRKPKIASGFQRFGLKAPGNGTLHMPELDFRAPRLFVDAPLRAGETSRAGAQPEQLSRQCAAAFRRRTDPGVQRPRRRMAGGDRGPQAARRPDDRRRRRGRRTACPTSPTSLRR